MEMLMSWITQIIIFILLAIIIEMFVPSTKVAKYVRLVIGLIFLLIFLQPILYIFQIDIEKIVDQSLFQKILTDEDIQQKESIDQQKDVLQANNDAYILTEVSNELKNQAAEILEDHFVHISHIEYQFANEVIHLNSLEQLIVYIEPMPPDEADEIIEIEEIVIDVDEHGSTDDSETLELIKQDLEEVWQLDAEDLIVIWGNDPS